ncbi:flagella synthesis protein FlgN [Thioalkalivibrio sp. ALgr3]|uniref:flagella synthesis protein FlgN n=1 Tax=Thioalkalivibrio sp. ALgr3 TaxID=1239292 RepID=UPI0003683342|nr:flagellar protein FlgN [Thioalkalivibrio sp. ALgr3]
MVTDETGIRPSLEESIRLGQRLEDILLEETRAIESREPDRLQAAVQRKQELLRALETETRKQQQWIEARGAEFTPEGVARLFARLEGGEHLNDRWQALRATIERCNELNQGNARLIERNQRRVQMSMQILRGEDSGPATTYDPYGKARHRRTTGQTITRA